MNERIKQLAEQARSWAEVSYKKQNEQFTSHWDTPIGYTPTQFFEQKFAELIVRECMKVVIDGKYSTDECRYNSHRYAHNDARDEASSDMKKHFGIKE